MTSINTAAAAQAAALQNQMAAQGLNGYPVDSGMAPGSLAALGTGGSKPQVNATNQSALAPNGSINQSVTNANSYTNKYYNIVTAPQMPYYGVGGGAYLPGSNGWGSPLSNNSFVDPQTGVLYVRQETGIVGWFKRLLRGY